MGKIWIHELPLEVLIGTFPDERLGRQKLIFDIIVTTDMFRAAETDELADAVDYSRVEAMVCEIAGKSSFRLLEALAGAIGTAVSALPGVQRCLVRIEKPGAVRVARTLTLEALFENGRMIP